ncbi:MAG: tRNA (adenosine(37)-N6)-threonylcarbamoyltransferase complex dimerization subunit type 1 TsaB, partial [Bacteroidales bacterium]
MCIETATDVCSVALCSDDKVISLREKKDGKSHSSLLTVFISEILKEQQISIENLKAVAVSKGPGSFTGLRIGVSVAKGIAYGSDIPLIAIDTLTSMYFGILPVAKENNLLNKNNIFCPMIDARRMEVFY